ncbi:MAG: acylphosphatase [Candidatus Peregrinibacteria bacterium]
MKQAVLKITGRVQGVFFRSSAREEAVALNLTGHARNMPDGTVEVLVQGAEEDIKKFIDWCKEGSPSAEVANVEIDWQPISGSSQNLQDFSTF